MELWNDVVAPMEAIATLRAAAELSSPGRSSMTHSWLITGPPGSGRSNLAYVFATALLSLGTPESDTITQQQVTARTHPDLVVVSSENVIISIEQVRQLVATSYYSPSVGRYRIMIIEDADRMTERTSNVLLKALEEPPERTVWILCAPSDADLLPTIRSRVRTVRLATPSVPDVARLLERRDGVDPITAERSAREAQCHIGMARRLATYPAAHARREETLRTVLAINSVSAAVNSAAKLLKIAEEDAKSISEQRENDDRQKTLHSLGIEPGKTVPVALRAQMRACDDDQKRRATRTLRDGLDRIFIDLLSLYRDIIMIQFGYEKTLINQELETELREAATLATPAHTLDTINAVIQARSRIAANVAPALMLESMLVSAIRQRSSL